MNAWPLPQVPSRAQWHLKDAIEARNSEPGVSFLGEPPASSTILDRFDKYTKHIIGVYTWMRLHVHTCPRKSLCLSSTTPAKPFLDPLNQHIVHVPASGLPLVRNTPPAYIFHPEAHPNLSENRVNRDFLQIMSVNVSCHAASLRVHSRHPPEMTILAQKSRYTYMLRLADDPLHVLCLRQRSSEAFRGTAMMTPWFVARPCLSPLAPATSSSTPSAKTTSLGREQAAPDGPPSPLTMVAAYAERLAALSVFKTPSPLRHVPLSAPL